MMSQETDRIPEENTLPENAAQPAEEPELVTEVLLDGEEHFARGADPRKKEGIFWSVDEDGVMIVGCAVPSAIADYDTKRHPCPPWQNYKPYIKSIFVEDGITELGIRAFADCPNLEEVSLPASLRKIDYACFSGCTKLSFLELPETMSFVHAYEGKSWMSNTVILGLQAFRGTPWARRQFGDFYIRDGAVFDYFGESADAEIPAGVTAVAPFAFAESGLRSVKFPQSIRRIGAYAFYRNKLTAVQLPPQITAVETHAFASNPALRRAAVPAESLADGCAPLHLRLTAAEMSLLETRRSLAEQDDKPKKKTKKTVRKPLPKLTVEQDAFAATPIGGPAEDLTEFPALYRISAKALAGVSGVEKLELQDAGKKLGGLYAETGAALLTRLKRGAAVVCVLADPASKRLDGMLVYRYNDPPQKTDNILEYRVLATENGTEQAGMMTPFRRDADFTKRFKQFASETCIAQDTVAPAADALTQWFVIPESRGDDSRLLDAIAKNWLAKHKDYTCGKKQEAMLRMSAYMSVMPEELAD